MASYGLAANAQPHPSIFTVPQYYADNIGTVLAYRRAELAGADYIQEFFHVPRLMPTTGTYTLGDYDRLVNGTTLPIVVILALVDGTGGSGLADPMKWYPSDIPTSTALTDSTVITAMTALAQKLADRTPAGRLLAVIVSNEVDEWLDADPGTRVAEMASFVGTMKTVFQSAFGGATKVGVNFTYFSLGDGSFSANSYATVANAGSDPYFTCYLVNPGTFQATDFTAPSGGMGDAFDAMANATGSFKPFGLTEFGLMSARSLCGSGPAGVTHGEDTQEQFIRTFVDDIETPFRPALVFVSFFRLHDLGDALMAGLPVSAARDFVQYLGFLNADGTPKLSWDDLVAFFGGSAGVPATIDRIPIPARVVGRRL